MSNNAEWDWYPSRSLPAPSREMLGNGMSRIRLFVAAADRKRDEKVAEELKACGPWKETLYGAAPERLRGFLETFRVFEELAQRGIFAQEGFLLRDAASYDDVTTLFAHLAMGWMNVARVDFFIPRHIGKMGQEARLVITLK